MKGRGARAATTYSELQSGATHEILCRLHREFAGFPASELLGTPPPPEPDEAPEPSDHRPPCPCCGGRMLILETFERYAQPRATAARVLARTEFVVTRHGMDGRKIVALLRSTVTYDHRPWKELATAHFSGDVAPTFDVEDLARQVQRHCRWPIARSRLIFPPQPNS